MPLGLDKTHKKEKKDRRFAQFNLILGAAADAGKREFNFTTRDKTTTYPWSSLSKISETISWLSQMTPSSIDLCCSATPWRTWRSSFLFKEERERESTKVCAYYKWGEEESKKTRADRLTDKKRDFLCTDADRRWQREKKRYTNPNSFLFTNLHFVFTELRWWHPLRRLLRLCARLLRSPRLTLLRRLLLLFAGRRTNVAVVTTKIRISL